MRFEASATGTRGGPWRAVAVAHAAYYLLTGLWPIVHIESFMAVTGPKVDTWLVQTFGALICVPGLALLVAVIRRRLDRSLIVVAIGSVVVLVGADVVFVGIGRISSIYLVDAAVELLLAIGWVVCLLQRRRSGILN